MNIHGMRLGQQETEISAKLHLSFQYTSFLSIKS